MNNVRCSLFLRDSNFIVAQGKERSAAMPPKKKEQPKAAAKVAVDKTFGLKNVSPTKKDQVIDDRLEK